MNKIEIKCYLLKQNKSKIRDSDELEERDSRWTHSVLPILKASLD
jgi:hypothetical protein